MSAVDLDHAVSNLQVNDSPSIDLQAMEADIRAIKGIGEKRADEVMKVVEKHVLGVEEVEDECD